MFGESGIFGQFELSIDSKGRIAIPSSTKREEGEELVLIYNEDFDIYEIYSAKRLEERFEELNDLLLKSSTEKQKRFYEARLLKLSKSILKTSKISSQGRMLTGKVFEGYEKVKTTGAYDHLILEPIKNKK